LNELNTEGGLHQTNNIFATYSPPLEFIIKLYFIHTHMLPHDI